MNHVNSFDVFDTVVVRRTGSPAGVFLVLGDRLRARRLVKVSPRVFQMKRIQAEIAVQPSGHRGGPSLVEIYGKLSELLDWNEAQAHEAMELEIETECEELVAVPSIGDQIARVRADGGRIAFLSDMYWSSAQLRLLLMARGAAFADDVVLVSSEERCGKTDGKLFRRMIERLRVPAAMVRHVGNNLSADIGGARQVGAGVEYFPDGNLSRAEKVILTDLGSHWDQYTAGTARLARLHAEGAHRDEHRRALTGVASAVVMPVLMNFAFWVVRRAVGKGIKRLIFVSRDGWLLEKCVRKALNNSQVEIDCRFIYGSRQAWHAAAVNPNHLEDCSWLFEGGDQLTFGRVLARLNLGQGNALHYARLMGLDLAADDILDSQNIAFLSQALGDSQEIRQEMAEVTASVLAYLRQEGLDSPAPTAIVDLGWVGRLQGSLNRLLVKMGANPVHGYYFGLTAARNGTVGAEREAFLFDQRHPESSLLLPGGLLAVVESFCTQRHGTTVGYRQAESGKWKAVFRREEEIALVNWGIDHVHQTCLTYLNKLPDNCVPQGESDLALVEKTRRILLRFVNQPDSEEARSWGAFSFEHEQAGGGAIPLARAYPLISEGWRIAMQNLSGELLGGYWRGGAKKLTPVVRRVALDILRKMASKTRPTRPHTMNIS